MGSRTRRSYDARRLVAVTFNSIPIKSVYDCSVNRRTKFWMNHACHAVSLFRGKAALPATIFQFVSENHLGDFASILDVLVTIIGFIVTIINVIRSRRAAELAKDSVEYAISSIKKFETVVDISSVIGMLEEIKRSHRSNQWAILPDRYATLRKTLINIRESRDLSDKHSTVIQGTIVNLTDMEKAVEKSLPDVPPNMHIRFNALLSEHVDALAGVLAELKFSESGGR